MKKVFMTFMTLAFMSGISFAGDSASFTTNCLEYAQFAMVDEQETYGYIHDRGEYLDGLNFYYGSCMSSGGNVGDPVFL